MAQWKKVACLNHISTACGWQCWETSDPTIHVDFSLTFTTYLSTAPDHVHPFMKMVLPKGCGLFLQDNAPQSKVQEGSGIVWEAQQVWGIGLASKFPSSQCNWVSVGCAGQTRLIHWGSTLQCIGLKGSVTIILVPETTAHLHIFHYIFILY